MKKATLFPAWCEVLYTWKDTISIKAVAKANNITYATAWSCIDKLKDMGFLTHQRSAYYLTEKGRKNQLRLIAVMNDSRE